MKKWIMTLPFLCAVGVAMAQGVEKEEAAAQPETVAVPAKPAATPAERAAARSQSAATPDEPVATPATPAATPDKAQAPAKAKTPAKAQAPAKAKSKTRIGKHSPKSLPKGDMRHCLDLKTQAEIIRCSETQRKK